MHVCEYESVCLSGTSIEMRNRVKHDLEQSNTEHLVARADFYGVAIMSKL
jgi:hypothetical protein